MSFARIVDAREAVDAHVRNQAAYTAGEHHTRMNALRDAIEAFVAEQPDWLSSDQLRTIRMYLAQSWYTWDHYQRLLVGMAHVRDPGSHP